MTLEVPVTIQLLLRSSPRRSLTYISHTSRMLLVIHPTKHLSVWNGRALYLFMNFGFARPNNDNNIIIITDSFKPR